MWHRFGPCMEPIKAFYTSHRTLCRGIIVAYAGITVLRWINAAVQRRRRNKIREGYPRDTVILHHMGRGPYAPSIVPASVKLETYLRMAKIPYKAENSMEKSSKQKWPWITYNGKDVADSAFCIDFLNNTYNVDLNSWLTAEQRAVALAFQRMLEENLYWAGACTRWVNEVDKDFIRKCMPMPLAPLYARLFISPMIRRSAWMQGMGRHSPEEIQHIAVKDLTALNNYLGRKKFLMGDKPCEQDCAMFGLLSQLLWQLPSSLNLIFKERFPQLVAYCERMRDQFWPDWVECTTQGGTVPATA